MCARSAKNCKSLSGRLRQTVEVSRPPVLKSPASQQKKHVYSLVQAIVLVSRARLTVQSGPMWWTDQQCHPQSYANK